MLCGCGLLLFMYDATTGKIRKFIALTFLLCLLPTQSGRHVIKADSDKHIYFGHFCKVYCGSIIGFCVTTITICWNLSTNISHKIKHDTIKNLDTHEYIVTGHIILSNTKYQ